MRRLGSLAEPALASSWRASPRSFVALMGLYESNDLRLRALAGDPRRLCGRLRSRVPGDCELVLTVFEQSPYTTTLELTYVLPDTGGASRTAPDMVVRLYHDARLAEALGWSASHSHGVLRGLRREAERELDHRWARNVMLNKWLEYCVERGHLFR
jgi:uncharacterized protein YqiB (DUF1249 family)